MPIPSYVARVLTELEARGFQAFCVGGCVRDCLLGRVPEDWDVTTSALPEQTMALFGDRAEATGLRHGTVTVRCGTERVEVTTFRREGTSVYMDQPVSFVQAALGAELEIPTIDGTVKYTMPEGTQSGTTFRLRGKGIPGLNGRGRGDQYVTVKVQVPTGLSRAQKDALKAFGTTMGETAPETDPLKNLFDKHRKKK